MNRNDWMMRLRHRLWLSHGHTGLYGDDGEMQCSRCGVDYLRASFDDILDRLDRLDLERMAEGAKTTHA